MNTRNVESLEYPLLPRMAVTRYQLTHILQRHVLSLVHPRLFIRLVCQSFDKVFLQVRPEGDSRHRMECFSLFESDL
jgi:hypothetical protein